MTDGEITKRTGIGASTFHRWQRGDHGGLPKVEKVRAFATGLDVPLQPALAALGLTDLPPAATEPELDPDIRRVARRLADPRVSDAEKEAIRNVLRLINRQMLVGAEPSKEAAG